MMKMILAHNKDEIVRTKDWLFPNHLSPPKINTNYLFTKKILIDAPRDLGSNPLGGTYVIPGFSC
jgi:hypothetical protein